MTTRGAASGHSWSRTAPVTAVRARVRGPRIAARRGIFAVREPPPSRRRASRSPPNTATRCRRPSRPRPSGVPGLGRPAGEHLDPQRPVGVAHRHLGRAAVAVLERVGQRLLDDPVRGEIHPGRQLARLAGDAYLDRQAGERDPVDERAEPAAATAAGPGRRPRRRPGRGQHAEQVAQLGHRVAAGGLDGEERLLGLVDVGGEHLPRGAGLDDHQADVVADDVVQFAGDAGALGVDRALGRALPLPLEQPAALLPGRGRSSRRSRA